MWQQVLLVQVVVFRGVVPFLKSCSNAILGKNGKWKVKMSVTTSASGPTIGMQLDAMLDELNNLSTSKLYGLIVAATIGLCLVLLGTGSNAALDGSAAKNFSVSVNANSTGKQPRWHIFKLVNYVAIFLFVGSVAQFGLNASTYLEQGNLASFVVGWSLFLCYFFGFFGVSFVYDDIPQQKQVSEEPAPRSAVKSPKTIQEPAASTPVCTDPSSFKKSSNVPANLVELPNEDIAQLVLQNQLKDHELETRLDPFRAVPVRRLVFNEKLKASLGNPEAKPLDLLPSEPSLDYGRVFGANCETVVGYIPLPVGLVGPMTLNNESIYFPMATTEGCLVASANRGAKAISQGGGAFARIVRDGITRAPCVRMGSAMEAADLKLWCEQPANFAKLKQAFETTTSFGKLQSCNPTVAGKDVFLRLVCFSGDAMGMNMVSKGSLAVIKFLQDEFPTLQLVALSGNMCTDKKAAAMNWLEGRGKSVVVEATIPASVVKSTLKTSVPALVFTNLHKNLIGSAMAGVVGGYNAHASNIVTAVFLATGQDPAQNVESSNCMTLMEETPEGNLWISCTMPSIEVGTVGGGTSLEAQTACLQVVGCKGGGASPGDNAKKLATVVAAATMAGELSLMAALAANTLVQAHMKHNRKPATSK
eukprot:Nitzschia sp. Nitz4//scaffold111_size72815//67337//69346//NITZ4_005802-RA/size72815-snap-gene-0.104-mRNA-1//1//CDS//3329533216//3849//frame0